jgi:hypothetical protein
MIELRWITAPRPHCDPYDGIYMKTTRVLQYRTAWRGVTNRDDPPSGMVYWSEWQDVPHEDDSQFAAQREAQQEKP